MTKSELIKTIAEDTGILSQQQVEFVVNYSFEVIQKALQDGDKVELRGFGSFRTRKKRSRNGRNPRTGEDVLIPEATFPHFRPSIEIKNHLIKNGISLVRKRKET